MAIISRQSCRTYYTTKYKGSPTTHRLALSSLFLVHPSSQRPSRSSKHLTTQGSPLQKSYSIIITAGPNLAHINKYCIHSTPLTSLLPCFPDVSRKQTQLAIRQRKKNAAKIQGKNNQPLPSGPSFPFLSRRLHSPRAKNKIK